MMDHDGTDPGGPTRRAWSSRELAYCGLFGAVALLLPGVFHVVRLGHVLMPMYLPLVALAFLVRARAAALTALVTPLVSSAVTGMPPSFPPVAEFMALELAVMAALISWSVRRWPRAHELLVLVPVLLLGRILYVGLVYLFSHVMSLPPGLLAGLSLLGGWPGVLLMWVVVPPVVRTIRGARRLRPAGAGER